MIGMEGDKLKAKECKIVRMEEEEERKQLSWRMSLLFMPYLCLRRLAPLGSPLITEVLTFSSLHLSILSFCFPLSLSGLYNGVTIEFS
jgi:hypothetical protein